jgi:tubulin-like protein CetZ
MRLLILGLGTAGSRIANAIAEPAGGSTRNTLHVIAVDNDPDILENLKYIRRDKKVYFPKDSISTPELLTTTFTIDEVKAQLKSNDAGGHDAVLLCAGLGGGLIDLVPHLVDIIRETMFEPVFALVTLPSDDEGQERLKRAAINMRQIRSTLDGVIVFDNQLWLDKVREQMETAVQQPGPGVTDRFWIPGTPEKTSVDPYDLINHQIAKRIQLLIQAGEVQDTPPQMVLDTREILNTITGMELITIGLADEIIEEHSKIGFFRQKQESLVYKQEKAGRIVKLAEKAVFRDISAYSELSSAKKALILLIGPEEELSMKGFMAVRKWIDDSINGYELRSGDSPISSRHGSHVAVLIVLSGLSEIPRVSELDRLIQKNQPQ